MGGEQSVKSRLDLAKEGGPLTSLWGHWVGSCAGGSVLPNTSDSFTRRSPQTMILLGKGVGI